MKDIPPIVSSISVAEELKDADDGLQKVVYLLNEGRLDEKKVEVYRARHYYKSTNDIVDFNPCFVNGFGLVQTRVELQGRDQVYNKKVTNEYAYLEQETGKLLPYRFEFATDFDDNDFAIVCKDGKITRIDKDFRYFNVYGAMVGGDIKPIYKFVGGFSIINSSLARMSNPKCKVTYYMDVEGKTKVFFPFDGEDIGDSKYRRFNYGTDFDSSGMAFVNGDTILFDSGVLCRPENLFTLLHKLEVDQKVSEMAKAAFAKRDEGETKELMKKL